jgi:hypothetical protein
MQDLSSNLIICSALRVGYSKKSYLKYAETWNYCIEFHFDIFEMAASDLYLILFSYLRYNKLYCHDLLTLLSSDSGVKFTSRTAGIEMRKKNYENFDEWWSYRQWYDSCLLETKTTYGFRLIFDKDVFSNFVWENQLTMVEAQLSLKPAYPWSNKIISIFDRLVDETNEEVFWEDAHPLAWSHKKKPKKL